MSRPAPSLRLLRALQASIEDRRSICSFCTKRKLTKTSRPPFSRHISSVTAVNAQKHVAEGYKDLYEQLLGFGRSATTYINTTQLQLALRSLESKPSATRIAILGINNRTRPFQLVQALLADPLSQEAPWENELRRAEQDSKPLLIRAGLKTSLDSSHPLLRTLTISSTLLEKHNVEIFLNHIVADPGTPLLLNEAALSQLVIPNLQAQESFSGHTSSVVFPVHRTIVVEDGLRGILGVAGLLQRASKRTVSQMIRLAANVGWEILPNQQDGIAFTNISKGQHSIRAFRENIQNAVIYEKEWLNSGLPYLTPLVLPDPSTSTALQPAVQDLINHILDETELAVKKSEAEVMERNSALELPESSKKALLLAISDWAEKAHTELRAEVATILESRAWRKLAWWKLFWRVDDISMVTSDAIRRAYLIEAEKSSIFLAGQFAQAGLLEGSLNKSPPVPFGVQPSKTAEVVSPEDDAPKSALEAGTQALLNPRWLEAAEKQDPWPSHINISRLALLHETIPPLVSAAQGHTLSALSVTGLTSLTSLLAYFSSTTTTMYEAGTIAAVGVVLSAYRLQTKWETARRQWLDNVQVEGKRALDATEQLLAKAVAGKKRGRRYEDDTQVEQDTRLAIEKVRTMMKEMDKKA